MVSVAGNTNGQCRVSAEIACYPTRNAVGSGQNGKNRWVAMTGNGERLLTVEVPASFIQQNNAKFIGIYLRIGSISNGGTVDNAVVKFSKVELIKMADADLIVDGSIRTEKVATNAIQTKHLTANAIKAGTVGATHIASK